jgi:hypothetical protein
VASPFLEPCRNSHASIFKVIKPLILYSTRYQFSY